MNRIALITIFASLAVTGFSQADVMHFKTNIGSFRMKKGSGRVELKFNGSVLVSTTEAKVTVAGNVRKEYDAHSRICYSGEGTLVVEGKFRAIQWFGRKLEGIWKGSGEIHFFGDFDSKGDTGEYWYGDSGQHLPWGLSGFHTLPEDKPVMPKPVERGKSGGG